MSYSKISSRIDEIKQQIDYHTLLCEQKVFIEKWHKKEGQAILNNFNKNVSRSILKNQTVKNCKADLDKLFIRTQQTPWDEITTEAWFTIDVFDSKGNDQFKIDSRERLDQLRRETSSIIRSIWPKYKNKFAKSLTNFMKSKNQSGDVVRTFLTVRNPNYNQSMTISWKPN